MTPAVRHLVGLGHQVSALDFRRPGTPYPEGVEALWCDLRSLSPAERSYDAIAHLAALAGVRPPDGRPDLRLRLVVQRLRPRYAPGHAAKEVGTGFGRLLQAYGVHKTRGAGWGQPRHLFRLHSGDRNPGPAAAEHRFSKPSA